MPNHELDITAQQLIAELYQEQRPELPEGSFTVQQYIAEIKRVYDKDISESTAKRFLNKQSKQGLLDTEKIPNPKGGQSRIWWKP